MRDFLGERIDATSFVIDDAFRGMLKQALIGVGYPAEDLAGYAEGADLAVELREIGRSGLPFKVRDYQRGAVDAFHAGGDARGGSGVIVLLAARARRSSASPPWPRLKKNTLVLTTSTTAVEQWRGRSSTRPTSTTRWWPPTRVSRRRSPRHSGHLSDCHLSAEEGWGFPAFLALQPARLGPDHL